MGKDYKKLFLDACKELAFDICPIETTDYICNQDCKIKYMKNDKEIQGYQTKCWQVYFEFKENDI